MSDDWTELSDAGIDITRIVILEETNDRTTYKITNWDHTYVEFGPVFDCGDLVGWTYVSYDDEGGVIRVDGGLALSDVARHVKSFIQ